MRHITYHELSFGGSSWCLRLGFSNRHLVEGHALDLCHCLCLPSAESHVARFLARLGKDVSDMLYTLDRMIGSFKELLGWDMVLE